MGNSFYRKEQKCVRHTDTSCIPQGFLKSAQIALARYGVIGSAARYCIFLEEVHKFVRRADSKAEKIFRRELIKKFERIQAKVPCAHSPYQFVLIAEIILNSKLEGALIECGCFKGGSTAKLSLLAKKTNRRLYVCDSFQGLPVPLSCDELSLTGNGDVPQYVFSPGEYKGSIDEVKENVRRYGCIEQCEFVPGLFSGSLPKLDVAPAFIFIDVDLITSAKECLKYLWPRLLPQGYFFTHEAAFPAYLRGLLDAQWWLKNLGESPPLIFGAGSGVWSLALNLAYFQKDVTA